MTTFIVELFRHNLWANREMLDVCATLTDSDLDATAAGTYSTVRDTLVHLFAAEGRYVAAFGREPPDPIVAEDAVFPGFELLTSHATRAGEALIQLAEAAQADDILEGAYTGQRYRMHANILYLHAINHATEHRAHINTILTQCGVEPPRLDGIAYFQTGAAG